MKSIFGLLVVASIAGPAWCFPKPGDYSNGMDDSRSMGYKKAKITTEKPTWRPWYQHPRAELEENMIDRHDPDGHFPDEYYDEYNAEVEGTLRNILAHGTAEDKFRTYSQAKVSAQQMDDIIQASKRTDRDRKTSRKVNSERVNSRSLVDEFLPFF